MGRSAGTSGPNALTAFFFFLTTCSLSSFWTAVRVSPDCWTLQVPPAWDDSSEVCVAQRGVSWRKGSLEDCGGIAEYGVSREYKPPFRDNEDRAGLQEEGC